MQCAHLFKDWRKPTVAGLDLMSVSHRFVIKVGHQDWVCLPARTEEREESEMRDARERER